MVSYSDLQTLGAMLRATREQNALSLEEVEAQTRIRVKFLEALENGDLSVLPSTAHARGFLRNYAQFLRLDANAIAMQFGVLTGTGTLGVTQSTAPAAPAPAASVPTDGTLSPAFDQDPAPASPSPTVPTPYPSPTGTGPLRARSTYVPPAQRVGPGVPSGVPAPPAQRTFTTPAYGVTVPVMQPQVIQPERPATPLHRLLQNNLFVGGVLVMAMIAIVLWAIASLSAIGSEQFSTTPDPSESIGALGSAAAVSPLSPFDVTLTPTSGGAPSIPLDRVLLNITVTQRSWALIVVDGETAFEGQLVPGSVVQYQGATSIRLRAGNGAGLTVNYNGQDLGVIGGPGEVVEIIFTPAGQITPTITPTLTPTNTVVPTPTPRGGGTATPSPRP